MSDIFHNRKTQNISQSGNCLERKKILLKHNHIFIGIDIVKACRVDTLSYKNISLDYTICITCITHKAELLSR